MANTSTVKSTASIFGAKIVLRKKVRRDGYVMGYRVEYVSPNETITLFRGLVLASASFWFNEYTEKAMTGWKPER